MGAEAYVQLVCVSQCPGAHSLVPRPGEKGASVDGSVCVCGGGQRGLSPRVFSGLSDTLLLIVALS